MSCTQMSWRLELVHIPMEEKVISQCYHKYRHTCLNMIAVIHSGESKMWIQVCGTTYIIPLIDITTYWIDFLNRLLMLTKRYVILISIKLLNNMGVFWLFENQLHVCSEKNINEVTKNSVTVINCKGFESEIPHLFLLCLIAMRLFFCKA